MIYFFPPEFGIILFGGLMIWLMIAGVQSAARLLSDGRPYTKAIAISCKQSADGHSHVEEECYYPAMKKYIAKVVCQELDSKWQISADSQEELESKIRKEYAYCYERIRDRINKRAVK